MVIKIQIVIVSASI